MIDKSFIIKHTYKLVNNLQFKSEINLISIHRVPSSRSTESFKGEVSN